MNNRSAMVRYFILFNILFLSAYSQVLLLPERITPAPTGSQFYPLISPLEKRAREDSIFAQISRGNIPQFLRSMDTIFISHDINGTTYTLEYYVTPDYLSVGCDSDYFLMPMTPVLAQKIAQYTQCILPTATMVDQIYSSAKVKLRPQPIPPDAEMVTVSRFWQHNDSVKTLRDPLLRTFPLGTLVAGTKKDVIIDNKIYSSLKPNIPKPVVIYGWHQLNGKPIQPVYNGHGETYADYSHGIRLIAGKGKINGAEISLTDILKDPVYFIFIADTVIMHPCYGNPASAE